MESSDPRFLRPPTPDPPGKKLTKGWTRVLTSCERGRHLQPKKQKDGETPAASSRKEVSHHRCAVTGLPPLRVWGHLPRVSSICGPAALKPASVCVCADGCIGPAGCGGAAEPSSRKRSAGV